MMSKFEFLMEYFECTITSDFILHVAYVICCNIYRVCDGQHACMADVIYVSVYHLLKIATISVYWTCMGSKKSNII